MTEPRLQVNISLTAEDSATLDALVAEVRLRSGVEGLNISRSNVAAVALAHGMDMMKRDFGLE